MDAVASYDGGAAGVGSRGTYSFPDDHSVVVKEDCCTTRYEVGRVQDGFTLRRVTPPIEEGDLLADAILFGEPFTRVP